MDSPEANLDRYGPGAAPLANARLSEPNGNANGKADGEEDDDDTEDEAEFIEQVVEEQVEVEEMVIKQAPFGEEFKASEWFMSAAEVESYHKYFVQATPTKMASSMAP